MAHATWPTANHSSCTDLRNTKYATWQVLQLGNIEFLGAESAEVGSGGEAALTQASIGCTPIGMRTRTRTYIAHPQPAPAPRTTALHPRSFHRHATRYTLHAHPHHLTDTLHAQASSLLGLSVERLRNVFLTRCIRAGDEFIQTPTSAEAGGTVATACSVCTVR